MRVRSSFVSARGVRSEAGSIVLDECCRGDGLRALQAKRPTSRSPFAKCKLANRALFLRFARFCPRVARFQLKFHNDPYKPRNTGLVCTWIVVVSQCYGLRGIQSLQATCGNVRAPVRALACARARLARLFLRKASEQPLIFAQLKFQN